MRPCDETTYECCMVFSDAGNACDAFPFEPDVLMEKAAELRGTVTVTNNPFGAVVTSSLLVLSVAPPQETT